MYKANNFLYFFFFLKINIDDVIDNEAMQRNRLLANFNQSEIERRRSRYSESEDFAAEAAMSTSRKSSISNDSLQCNHVKRTSSKARYYTFTQLKLVYLILDKNLTLIAIVDLTQFFVNSTEFMPFVYFNSILPSRTFINSCIMHSKGSDFFESVIKNVHYAYCSNKPHVNILSIASKNFYNYDVRVHFTSKVNSFLQKDIFIYVKIHQNMIKKISFCKNQFANLLASQK